MEISSSRQLGPGTNVQDINSPICLTSLILNTDCGDMQADHLSHPSLCYFQLCGTSLNEFILYVPF
jgi:hypothetical protein